MKRCIFFMLLVAMSLGATNCNKKENSPEKNRSALPQNARHHLQLCSNGCKTYVQLVSLGGLTYFYLGITGALCDPNPDNSRYLEITGEPVVTSSDLYAQLEQNGILLNEIYNCDDQ
jgi:hypothetical protein